MAGGECDACGKKRHHSDVPPVVGQVLGSSGMPLDATTRAIVEPRFGRDFSHVRVHADAQAAESARAVNALAYTVGRDVVFADGHYPANTVHRRKLLAHELTHVIQQDGGTSGGRPHGRLTISQPGDALEREADTAAGHVMSGELVSASRVPSHPTIQREAPAGDVEKPPEKKDDGEVIAEGLKTVAEQAADNNPQVKKAIIEPIKDRLKGQWNRLGTGEKAATIGVGAATLGISVDLMKFKPGDVMRQIKSIF